MAQLPKIVIDNRFEISRVIKEERTFVAHDLVAGTEVCLKLEALPNKAANLLQEAYFIRQVEPCLGIPLQVWSG